MSEARLGFKILTSNIAVNCHILVMITVMYSNSTVWTGDKAGLHPSTVNIV